MPRKVNYKRTINVTKIFVLSISISEGNCETRFPEHFSTAVVGAKLEARTREGGGNTGSRMHQLSHPPAQRWVT